jgi:microcystin-dependent protein
MDNFIGEIRIFASNFPPKGWAFCNGQILPIVQNTALFSLLGTTYGGDGKSTFALPNLQARFPMHAGQGPGLTPRTLGEEVGSAAVSLTSAQLPAHSHVMRAGGAAESTDPAGRLPAAPPQPPAGTLQTNNIYGGTGNPAGMAASAIGATGGGQPHNNMQPYLALSFIIALQGIYPPRS